MIFLHHLAPFYPARMEPLLAHLKYLTDQALPRGDEQAALLANELGNDLYTTADYAGTRPYGEQALTIRRKVLGEEHPDTALGLNNPDLLLKTTERIFRCSALLRASPGDP